MTPYKKWGYIGIVIGEMILKNLLLEEEKNIEKLKDDIYGWPKL